jgi:hypothetical protein
MARSGLFFRAIAPLGRANNTVSDQSSVSPIGIISRNELNRNTGASARRNPSA